MVCIQGCRFSMLYHKKTATRLTDNERLVAADDFSSFGFAFNA